MSNLIPITRIYDIYPRYTFSKDVKRFMDEIVDIPRVDAYRPEEVASMLTVIQMKIAEMSHYESPDGQELVMLADIGEVFDESIRALKEKKDGTC